MPDFHHSFVPASGSSLGATASLTVREVEDAGLREILQTPGAGLGNWGLFDALLDTSKAFFVFREPLGQAREVKTAVSGLFGRFVARAYATRHLRFRYFQHIYRLPMRLGGPTRGEVRRVHRTRGDLPDWAAWGRTSGLAIIEAKGCHDSSGPTAALNRAYTQAGRAEIVVQGRLATFKRYAIATRWGFSSPTSSEPFLAVRDPDIEGDGIAPYEEQALGLGIVRRHCASLLRPLGHLALAEALTRLATTPFHNRQRQAREDARSALEHSPVRSPVRTAGADYPDDLIGGFVTRNGPFDGLELSPTDQQTLVRLKMKPTFVGIERRLLKLVIESDAERDDKKIVGPDFEAFETDRTASESDQAGSWIIRVEEDGAQIK